MLPRFDADGSFTKREIVLTVVLVWSPRSLWRAGAARPTRWSCSLPGRFLPIRRFDTGSVGFPNAGQACASRLGSRLPVVLGTMMAWKAW